MFLSLFLFIIFFCVFYINSYSETRFYFIDILLLIFDLLITDGLKSEGDNR